ncbi:hypothetical protein L198_02638 [Cryptococcus wingfieldii CBS 7118]|uniref:Uncharacterized protein n=1 Tax=Cryptococcus wingfieldii CBS 7118 TaxID=1295528 RepID=A0A1E3JM08_9TREE|nr:hypothetical protein L198_02638 [Cryptococcus wingfieldii CBS 7118]ODO01909.1 hypothetical protein L198_02638 [Cryptococcus wingfieldii CBS 7118]
MEFAKNMRVVFKIHEDTSTRTYSIVPLVEEESENAIIKHIEWRTVDTAGRSQQKVQYLLSGADQMWTRMRVRFKHGVHNFPQVARDFLDKKECELVELTTHSFPFRKAGTDTVV